MHLLRSKATVMLLCAASPAALAAPPTGSRPLVLDTQRGISDGRSGNALQTGPLSHSRAGEMHPGAAPDDMAANGSPQYPYIVAPYIQVPVPAPTPLPPLRPRPTPHSP